MADTPIIEKTDKTPLLKEKKPRPPQSEKQMENFKIMREKRANNVELRKADRLLTAQKALLEREGYVKKEVKQTEPVKQSITFDVSEEEEEKEEIPQIMETPKIQRKKAILKEKLPPPVKPVPKAKQSKVPRIVEKEYDHYDEDIDDSESSSDEEVIIIKRSSSKKKQRSKVQHESLYEQEAPTQDFTSFFC